MRVPLLFALHMIKSLVTAGISCDGKEAACLNSDQPVKTATNRCRQIHLKHVFVAMSVRFVRHVLILSWKMSALIAAVALYKDQSDHRKTGRTIIISAMTRPAGR